MLSEFERHFIRILLRVNNSFLFFNTKQLLHCIPYPSSISFVIYRNRMIIFLKKYCIEYVFFNTFFFLEPRDARGDEKSLISGKRARRDELSRDSGIACGVSFFCHRSSHSPSRFLSAASRMRIWLRGGFRYHGTHGISGNSTQRRSNAVGDGDAEGEREKERGLEAVAIFFLFDSNSL